MSKSTKPTAGHPYWLYDPQGDGLTYYKTEAERDAAAALSIQSYLGDDGWDDEVEHVSCGVVTHSAQCLSREMRPDDLDEDGYAGDGSYWPDDLAWRGDYKMEPTVQAPAEGDELDRDEAIRVWRRHCDKFSDALKKEPPSPVIDAMLEFARAHVQPKHTALTVPGGPEWLLPGDVAVRIAYEFPGTVTAPLVQSIAKAVYQLRASQAPAPAPEAGPGEKWEADVECITDESGTDYSVSIRGPGLRNPDYSDVWMKKRPAEQLAKWLNTSVLPRFNVQGAAVQDGLTDEQRIDWLCEEAVYTCGQWQVVFDSDKKSFIDAVDELAALAHGIDKGQPPVQGT